MDTFNSTAATLAIASALAAINPLVHGYISLTVEVGNDTLVSVDAQNTPQFEIFSYRVWTHDGDCNEVDVPLACIDTELIESAINA